MVVFLVGLGSAFAHPPQNFNYAKKMVYALFRGHESTLIASVDTTKIKPST